MREIQILEMGERAVKGMEHENFRFIWPDYACVRTADDMPIPEVDVMVWRYKFGYRQ